MPAPRLARELAVHLGEAQHAALVRELEAGQDRGEGVVGQPGLQDGDESAPVEVLDGRLDPATSSGSSSPRNTAARSSAESAGLRTVAT